MKPGPGDHAFLSRVYFITIEILRNPIYEKQRPPVWNRGPQLRLGSDVTADYPAALPDRAADSGFDRPAAAGRDFDRPAAADRGSARRPADQVSVHPDFAGRAFDRAFDFDWLDLDCSDYS